MSGDFYWIHKKKDKVLFATVDCTGHGVPGAFMSIVGYNLLKQVVSGTDTTEPGIILDALNEGVSETLHNTDEGASAKDGMDLSLCSIDLTTLQVEFAGAYNPMYLIRNNEIQEIKADKFPIGFFVGHDRRKFTNHKIQLMKGDCIYIFSDGFVDQFGGVKGKKFKAKAFRELLLSFQDKSMKQQNILLNQAFETWKDKLEQVDDVCVIGVRID